MDISGRFLIDEWVREFISPSQKIIILSIVYNYNKSFAGI